MKRFIYVKTILIGFLFFSSVHTKMRVLHVFPGMASVVYGLLFVKNYVAQDADDFDAVKATLVKTNEEIIFAGKKARETFNRIMCHNNNQEYIQDIERALFICEQKHKVLEQQLEIEQLRQQLGNQYKKDIAPLKKAIQEIHDKLNNHNDNQAFLGENPVFEASEGKEVIVENGDSS